MFVKIPVLCWLITIATRVHLLKHEMIWSNFKNAQHVRARRSTAFNPCNLREPITVAAIIVNVNYGSLNSSKIKHMISKMSEYTGLHSSRIEINQHFENHHELSKQRHVTNAYFVALGEGDGIRNHSLTTIIKYVISCSPLSVNDSKIVKLKKDAKNGLSGTLGYRVSMWFVVSGLR